MIQHPAVLFFLVCMGGLAVIGLAYVAVAFLARWGVFSDSRD